MGDIFGRVIRSSKVQVTFLPFIVAVIVAAFNGSLNEDQVMQLVTLLYTKVIPVLLMATGLEDAAKKFGEAKAQPAKPAAWVEK